MIYTVIGAWENGQRFGELFEATTARGAERRTKFAAAKGGGTLWVCRLFEGEQVLVDRYTFYTDPQDERNQDMDTELDVPDFTRDNPDWLVCGFAVPEGITLEHPDFGRLAERHAENVNAPSPLIAEDAARGRIESKGGQLIVCSVLEGCPSAADSYAIFADPDVR